MVTWQIKITWQMVTLVNCAATAADQLAASPPCNMHVVTFDQKSRSVPFKRYYFLSGLIGRQSSWWLVLVLSSFATLYRVVELFTFKMACEGSCMQYSVILRIEGF